jgi:thiol-disulfide isomerase/thioredoxin
MNKLLILFSLLIGGISASAQEVVTVQLKKDQVKFIARDDSKKYMDEGVVMGWILRTVDADSGYILPGNFDHVTVYYVTGGTLFNCYLPEKLRWKRFDLILAEKKDGSLWVSVDENGNRDFSDDVLDRVWLGKPMFRMLNLVKDSTGAIFQTPVEISVKSYNGDFEISLSNLSKFSLSYNLEDTILNIGILTNFYNTNFKLTTDNLATGKLEDQVFLMNEPFLFNGKLRVLENLDILNQTVELRTLASDELPYGYREGYYVNMDRLIELTEADSNMLDCSIEWKKYDYFLLDFWGQWCQPCLEKTGEVKQMYEMFEKTGKVKLISYPVILGKKKINTELTELGKCIAERNLPCPQKLQFLTGGGGCSLKFTEGNTVTTLFRVSEFPTYVLIDKKGKIFYWGSDKRHELQRELYAMGLWTE